MIAVIFEVWPADGCKTHYMDHAARLRDVLHGMDGFISVERFQKSPPIPINCYRCRSGGMKWRSPVGAINQIIVGHRRRAATASFETTGYASQPSCATTAWQSGASRRRWIAAARMMDEDQRIGGWTYGLCR